MDEIFKYLKSHGPQLSTTVAEHLCNRLGISRAAARQRVSRTKGSVKRLGVLPFPRKARFLYLEEQFASPWYWQNLEQVLRENTTAYGYALSALLARDGMCFETYFPIICGAPEKQKGQLSASVVLDRLIEAGLVERVHAHGFAFISIRQKAETTQQIIPYILGRYEAERLLIDNVGTWLKNLNLVSYGSVRTRFDQDLPKVGTYYWDVSGPSYLSPMLKRSKEGTFNPGFWACDVFLGKTLSASAAGTFLRKCSNTRVLRNLPPSMQMIVAYQFSEEAFSLLKKNGVIPATVRNLFGREAEKALKGLVDTLASAYRETIDAEKLSNVLDELKRQKNDLGTLKGTLFELLVRDVLVENIPGIHSVEVGHIAKLDKDTKAETDVLVHSKAGVRLIETKAYNPSYPLPDKEVDRWLDHNIPTVTKFARLQAAWRNEALTFEMWSTAPLSAESIARIEDARSRNAARYSIVIKQADEVRAEFLETKNKALQNILKNHFLKKL